MNVKASKTNNTKGGFDVAFPSAPKMLVVAVALACTSSAAIAANRTWTGTTGTWSSSSNWQGNNRPSGSSDDVTINPTNGNYTVTYDGPTGSSYSLTINSLSFSSTYSPDTLTLTGTNSNPSTLTVTGSFSAANSTSNSSQNSTVNINQYATLNLNGTSTLGNLNLAGGTLGGSGAVTANGATTWSGGTMTGSGSTAANGGLTVNGSAGSVVLQRTLTGSTLTVNNGKTLDIQADKNLEFTYGSGGTITNNGTLQKTGGTGTTLVKTDSIVTNTGTIIANSGTLTFERGVSGTTGTLQTTGGTLSLGTVASNSTTGTLNIGTGGLALNGRSLTVSRDYLNSNFGNGDSFNRTASVTAGGAGGVINAANISGGESSAATFQQLSVNGGATKTAGNTTLALGNIHVGGSIGAAYNIYNMEGTGGVTLRGAIQTNGSAVDARLSGAGVDTANSSWTATASGAAVSEGVTLTGSSAGAVNSQVKIVNNFANTNSQILTITGGVYQYAQVGLTPSPVAFANKHVGDTATQALSITNTNIGTPSGYQELLNASVTGANGSASGSGSFTGLAVGATNSSITVGLNTSVAGNQSGTVTVTPVSNGTGTSGLGNTTLAQQVVSVSGKVYQYAQPTFSGSNPVNFGIVHVGDTASQSVGITNTSAAPAGYQEKLNASISTGSTGITTAGGPVSIAQGASSSALSVGINTATAGARSGTATVGLVSDGAGTSGLGTTNLAGQNISVLGQVNNYAAVGLAQSGGAGTFSGSGTSYVFDLGTIYLGTGSAAGSLSLTNTGGSAAYTDLLSGAFNLAGVTNFTLTGFNSFSGLSGGSSLGLGVTLNNNALGTFDQLVTLTPTGYNASGYSGGLNPITIALKGNVVAAVPEPATYAMLLAGLGLMGGIARRRRQSV